MKFLFQLVIRWYLDPNFLCYMYVAVDKKSRDFGKAPTETESFPASLSFPDDDVFHFLPHPPNEDVVFRVYRAVQGDPHLT